MPLRILAGVDGGGSKTLCVVANELGEVLGYGRSDSSNINLVGGPNMKRNIEESIQEAIEMIGQAIERVDIVFIGMAGYGTRRDEIEKHLGSLGRAKQLFLDSDAVISLMAGTLGQPGLVVISGTGSIAFGLDERGNRARAGGWGYLLGDEGSGFYIGKEALSAALMDYDGRGRRTNLAGKISRKLGVTSIGEVVGLIYSEDRRVEEIADLAPLVLEAANEGDHVSREILVRAARELALCALAVAKRLNFQERSIPIVLAGGTFKSRGIFLDILRSEIGKKLPRARIELLRYEPALGALLLAFKEARMQLTREVLDRIDGTVMAFGGALLY